MAERKSTTETEIKLRLTSASSGRRILRKAGFRIRRRRLFESNIVYDTIDGALCREGRLLRIRQTGRTTVLTYKGPPLPSKHKSREELEVHLSDAAIFAEVLLRLGMKPSFRYEKFRAEFYLPNSPGIATVDETPIGDYLELEGPPDWIDDTAHQLGFTELDHIKASYADLYVEFTATQTNPPKHMLFR